MSSKPVRFAVAACIAWGVAGCASLEPPYVPTRTGALDRDASSKPLGLTISTAHESTWLGEPIIFKTTVRNNSAVGLWVPKDPKILFTWIYPNGQHDNFLVDFEESHYFEENECVYLKPGQEMAKNFVVKTYYFDRPGITEFRATLQVPRNSNPTLVPFWNGQTTSNGYGIRVEVTHKL